MTRDVFLFGTLRHEALRAHVIGGEMRSVPARLPGHVVLSDLEGLPVPVARPGEDAEGLLISGLDAGQEARLDAYEVPFGYVACEMTVADADGRERSARVYFAPDAVAEDAPPWDLERWVRTHGAAARFAAEEIAAHDPAPAGPALSAQWPRIRARSEARARAAGSMAVATMRHAPEAPERSGERVLGGDFFKLVGIDLSFGGFDGARVAQSREVFVGFDAALVLPWDAARGRVMLVEQLRAGPATRRDPCPWTLEPVAGLVDAGEGPDEAAAREAREEAGLTFSRLERMFGGYPSPGASTEFYHCYLGHADLPEEGATLGGLEDEDIRRHVLTLDAALALVDTGEVTAMPAIAMLLWLDRQVRRAMAMGEDAT